jgi:hypothetical protein
MEVRDFVDHGINVLNRAVLCGGGSDFGGGVEKMRGRRVHNECESLG